MAKDERPVLVIGATGFLGGHLVAALQGAGRPVRCLVRTPTTAGDLGERAEIVPGDMLDATAVGRAVDGSAAVIVAVHTISPQPAGGSGRGFMDIEAEGLRTIAAACVTHGVRRVVYVTSIGVAQHGSSSWSRGRWATEQALLASGLDATVVRPGMIVGRGGDGFGLVARAATHRFSIAVGSPRMRFRTVAVEDLARDLVDLVDASGSFGKVLEAGSDDVLTMRQMAAVAASSLGRRPGRMVFVPAPLLRALAPVIERVAGVPRGAVRGFVGDGPPEDMIGDPAELRALLGRGHRPFAESIEGQVGLMPADERTRGTAGSALWLDSLRGTPRVGSAGPRTPGPGELVVRVRAVAVNPIDAIGGLFRRVVLPWLRYPAVLGSDVAGVVTAVGPGVSRFGVGDRVLGHAAGTERSRNRPEEGAFQTHVVLLDRVTTPLPDSLSFDDAAALPLALSTAAAALFEPDQLALATPGPDAAAPGEVVVVWGGSTSVGMNAIQLARHAGHEVVATASPRNFALLDRLGAEAAFDYHDPSAADAIAARLRGRRLAGVVAIGKGSLEQALRITRRTQGSRRIASAYPTPWTRLRAVAERRRGIAISAIWGGSPIDSAVGPAIYADFLPDALAQGRYLAAPEPLVVGSGLDQIPAAWRRLREGVSAQKIVVTLD